MLVACLSAYSLASSAETAGKCLGVFLSKETSGGKSDAVQ